MAKETEFEDDYIERQNYTQVAFDTLYRNKNYISINDDLYRFQETHYQLCNKQLELKKISSWCETYSYKITEKSKINNILDWSIIKLSVNPDKVNPDGINLKNGVLRVIWDKKTRAGKVKLTKHNPNVIYTYVSNINYDPTADNSDCLKLLECLDPPERKIFLRAIASSFDLPFLRKVLGRNRALMLEGKGSNGKDTLGAVVREIFGFAMTNCSLGDFVQYDNGRKFPLAKLENSLISWSSENTALGSLDSVQSLKAAITGDLLDCEQKNKDEHSFIPKCLFIFNCNEPPKIKTGLEAIKSRWAILRFTKTYKMNPNKKMGELQAEPRFKDDPSFIREKIAPAFLNLLISELEDLVINGIDYAPVQESFEQLKRESSHLFQFCDDVGIVEDPTGKIYINDLWELLRTWYIDNGVLEVETTERGKEKLIWHDQSNRYDRNCKASNQIFQRFSEIFPNVARVKETVVQEKVGQSYLTGIGQIASFDSCSDYEQNTASLLPHSNEPTHEAVSITQKGNESNEAINPKLFLQNTVKNLPHEQKFDFFKEVGLSLGIPLDQLERLNIFLTQQTVFLGVASEKKFKVGDLVSPILKGDQSWYGLSGEIIGILETGGYKVQFKFKQALLSEDSLELLTDDVLEIKDSPTVIKILREEIGMDKITMNQLIKLKFSKSCLDKLNDSEVRELIDHLKKMPKKSLK